MKGVGMASRLEGSHPSIAERIQGEEKTRSGNKENHGKTINALGGGG